jgi:hypothetical protein
MSDCDLAGCRAPSGISRSSGDTVRAIGLSSARQPSFALRLPAVTGVFDKWLYSILRVMFPSGFWP